MLLKIYEKPKLLTNYSIVIKQSFIDGVFTIFSFGLYTPTTIILKK